MIKAMAASSLSSFTLFCTVAAFISLGWFTICANRLRRSSALISIAADDNSSLVPGSVGVSVALELLPLVPGNNGSELFTLSVMNVSSESGLVLIGVNVFDNCRLSGWVGMIALVWTPGDRYGPELPLLTA